MNQSRLKTYAPKARNEFIKAVTSRAAYFGISQASIEPCRVEGDVAFIGGRPFPAKIDQMRQKLVERIEHQGFAQVMEAVAYTWFNRFVAIRYMEIHNYLGHGLRVLSHPTGEALPEILSKAEHVGLEGLDRNKIITFKLAGNQDNEIYKLLLIAQCNALHKAMPFLFESVDDETELLLPDNLLHSDSILRKMVESVPDEDWSEVEILGWLYQYYISEKKDQVIGDVVKSEDIPAATQLFTPNWIVKYMVQNSLGAKWLATYPDSPLKAKMEYYIAPAEQTEEVKQQLKELTPESLNPEELTLMDPACGSGHILVEAYNLLKEIYLERGYRLKDIPRLILTKNLYGLDIDDRAAQLAGLAVLMRARADDWAILNDPPNLNIVAIQQTNGLDPDDIVSLLDLQSTGLTGNDIIILLKTFENAKTFGSLIEISDELKSKIPLFINLITRSQFNLFSSKFTTLLGPLVNQAELLSSTFDAVVANPPYMGGSNYCSLLRNFTKSKYKAEKADLYSCFISRAINFAKVGSAISVVTIQNWMFLSSFESFRANILVSFTIKDLTQIGYNSFPEMNSKIAQASIVSIRRTNLPGYRGTYINLNNAPQSADKNHVFIQRDLRTDYLVDQSKYFDISGAPIAYWLSSKVFDCFRNSTKIKDIAQTKSGMSTTDNEQFLRFWYEVERERIGFGYVSADDANKSGKKWFPYCKGGSFRKWYGNLEYVVNWEANGRDIRACIAADPAKQVGGRIVNEDYYFKGGIGWSDLTSGILTARVQPNGCLFDSVNPVAFSLDEVTALKILGLLNSQFANYLSKVLNPSLHFTPGNAAELPYPKIQETRYLDLVKKAVEISKSDWNSRETSWDYQIHPLFDPDVFSNNLELSVHKLLASWQEKVNDLKSIEHKNDIKILDYFELDQSFLTDQKSEYITLFCNPDYRFSGKRSAEIRKQYLVRETISELVSFTIGCLVGRFSIAAIDKKNSENRASRIAKFAILPITIDRWFEEDALEIIKEFFGCVWPKSEIENNLHFIASSLSSGAVTNSEETIRLYLVNEFFAHHLKLYKRRPIYWLFSSGKLKAFQAIVYLHSYNEGTLATMRTEYVIPLLGKMVSRIEQLEKDIEASSSSSHQKKLKKEQELLVKQRVELQQYDEKLRHYADMRIKIDLDDGVKVNYAKFGDLLAEVKTVCGKNEED